MNHSRLLVLIASVFLHQLQFAIAAPIELEQTVSGITYGYTIDNEDLSVTFDAVDYGAIDLSSTTGTIRVGDQSVTTVSETVNIPGTFPIETQTTTVTSTVTLLGFQPYSLSTNEIGPLSFEIPTSGTTSDLESPTLDSVVSDEIVAIYSWSVVGPTESYSGISNQVLTLVSYDWFDSIELGAGTDFGQLYGQPGNFNYQEDNGCTFCSFTTFFSGTVDGLQIDAKALIGNVSVNPNGTVVSNVPVPGAVWLFLSAMGLLGWRRVAVAN